MNWNFSYLVYLLIAIVGILLIKSILSLIKRYSTEDDFYEITTKGQEEQDIPIEEHSFESQSSSPPTYRLMCGTCYYSEQYKELCECGRDYR